KTDINNNGPFSTDFISASYEYPEGSYEKRAKIRKEHENYIRGFLTFLATSPRVPEHMRKEVQAWGPCKDEFQDTGGWPNQVDVMPYPISYRSIVPRSAECQNLFVPVCLSASHIAYGSIRMEPVFMIVGQSAATAASMAIDGNVPVQEVSYEKLRSRLLKDKQILSWPVRTE